MRRTNRVEPITTNSDAGDLTRATVTTTTRMEFVRRIQVVPMSEAVAQLHSDLNQSLAGEVIISPRIWTAMNRAETSVAVSGSRRSLWFIGGIFITVGLLALVAMIVALTIAFGHTNAVGQSDIERYDLGDMRYGMDYINNAKFLSDTYLSSDNKDTVQQYLSDQLRNEPGYRGLLIDGVLVQQQSASGRKRRAPSSCSTVFVIRNIQVYFDQCSTCTGSRNLALRRSLYNVTAFQRSLNLAATGGNSSQVTTQICSTPSPPDPILPVRLSVLQAQQIDSSLLPSDAYVTVTTTQPSYSVNTYSNRPTSRSSGIFTSRGVSTQKITTTTTTSTLPPVETSSPMITTMLNDISTIVSTIPTEATTDSTLTTESTTEETSTVSQKIDETTSSIDLTTTSGTIKDSTTAELFDSTATVSVDKTTTFGDVTSVTNEMSTTGIFEQTTTTAQDFSQTTSNKFSEMSTSTQIEQTTSLTDLSTTSGLLEGTTSSGDLSTTSAIVDQTTSFQDLSTTSGLVEQTTYTTDFTSSSIQSLSTESVSFHTDTTTEFSTVTSSSMTDFTSGETSTFGSAGSTTISSASEISTTSYSEELTSSTTNDLSTVHDTTTESGLYQSTTNPNVGVSSDSSTEIPPTTSLYPYSTGISTISTIFDSTTNKIETDTSSSSSFYDQSTSFSSTNTITMESTIVTDGYIQTSSSFSSMATDSTTDTSSTSVGLDQSSSSSTSEYRSTESLLTTDLALTTSNKLFSNEPDTTSSKLDTITTVVSTSGMIITSSLWNDITDEQRLYSSAFTTIASSPNANIESSSITSEPITYSTTQSTGEVESSSTQILQTRFDISSTEIDHSKTSIEGSSQYPSLITTISSTNEQMKFTTPVNQDISSQKSSDSDTTTVTRTTNIDTSGYPTSEGSSNPSDNDSRTSTLLLHSLTSDYSETSLTYTTSSTEVNRISDFITSSIFFSY